MNEKVDDGGGVDESDGVERSMKREKMSSDEARRGEVQLGRLLVHIADSSSSQSPASHLGFTFQAFGYRVILPEYAPGWVYFWLLMAAGCGLFISEDAKYMGGGIFVALAFVGWNLAIFYHFLLDTHFFGSTGASASAI